MERVRVQRSRRAVAAAVDVARAHGVRVGEPRVLADLFSLMVQLPPAPVVARVATCMPRLREPIADWLRQEIEVTTFLAGQGAPVVAPSRELPPGPHTRDGFAISFWTYLEPDPERTPTVADCSAMLVDLHAVLRTYPGELPPLGIPDIARGMAALGTVQPSVLSDVDHELLRASAQALETFLDKPGNDLQPLHGDVHPGNIVATRDGLMWIDFEDACVGPVEWDLASMMDTDTVARHHRPDPELLARCTQLRALQVALAMLAFHDDFGDLEGWGEGIRSMLHTLRQST